MSSVLPGIRAPSSLPLILAIVLVACQGADRDGGWETQPGGDTAGASEPFGTAPASPDEPSTDGPSRAPVRGAGQTGTATFIARARGETPDVGIPIYPGAHALAGGTWLLSDQMDEGAESLTTFALFTPHRLAAVIEFYRGRLQVDPAAIFTLQDRGGRSVSITVDTPGYTVNLLLRESVAPQGTRIEVSAMAAPPNTPPT